METGSNDMYIQIFVGTFKNGWNGILDALVGLVHIWNDSNAIFNYSYSDFHESSNVWF